MKTKFNKLMAWALTLAMFMSFMPSVLVSATGYEDTWHEYAAESFESGTGTSDDPYMIKTAEQLAKLSKDVADNNSYGDMFFKLIADINLAGHRWIPIGLDKWGLDGDISKPFCGSFDGGNYKIKNMYIDSAADGEYVPGLFGKISNFQHQMPIGPVTIAPEIKNITLDGATVIYTVKSGHYNQLSGIFAGIIEGNAEPRVKLENITVSNSTITNDVYNDDYAYQSGGFSAYIDYASVKNCKTENVTISGGANNGGFVGVTAGAYYENCSASGSVSGDWAIGGFVAHTEDGTEFVKCIADTDVMANDWNAGGFCGLAVYDVSFEKCVAYGDVKSTVTNFEPNVGGFIGRISNNYWDEDFSPSFMTNCYFAGTVTSAHETIMPGGLAGVVEESTLTDCAYDGELNDGIKGYAEEEFDTSLTTKGLKREICINVFDGHDFENNVCKNCEYADYDISVNGVQVTSDNASDVMGDEDEGASVSYDIENKALILNNATITSQTHDLISAETDKLVIKLVGTNGLEGDSYGIVNTVGDIEICSDENATLSVDAEKSAVKARGKLTVTEKADIILEGKDEVTVDAEILDVKGGQLVIMSENAETVNSEFDFAENYAAVAAIDIYGEGTEPYDAEKAGTYKYILIAKREEKPTVNIDFTEEKLTGFEEGKTYEINDDTAEIGEDKNLEINEEWFGTTISVVTKGNIDSEALELVIPEREAAPEVTGGQGTIRGTDTTMEYRLVENQNWNECAGDSVTGLSAGTYEVRVKATESSFASDVATVTVTAKQTTSLGGLTGSRPFGGGVAAGAKKTTVKEVEWANPFTDVDEDDWFYGDVRFVSENKLMNGTANSMFTPDEFITRAMLVTILYRAEDEPETKAVATFADMQAGAYYEKAVIWAQANGIVKGYSDTEFAPGDNVTREQIAAIMYRYADYKGVTPWGSWAIGLEYEDTDQISEYAVEPVMYCTMKEIMTGKEDNMFAPHDFATRAEIAAIFHRFMK